MYFSLYCYYLIKHKIHVDCRENDTLVSNLEPASLLYFTSKNVTKHSVKWMMCYLIWLAGPKWRNRFILNSFKFYPGCRINMVQAWFMDSSNADQRLPHQLDPPQPVSLEDLSNSGVLYWKVKCLMLNWSSVMSLILSSPLGSRTETGEGEVCGAWPTAMWLLVLMTNWVSLGDICSAHCPVSTNPKLIKQTNHHSTRNYPMDTVN